MTTTETTNTRSAAITGAGSGLGRELALQLAAKGYAVFGTAMSDGEREELASASNGRVKLTIVDITDEQAVQEWAKSVHAEVGIHGLDLLINNAGILTPRPIEHHEGRTGGAARRVPRGALAVGTRGDRRTGRQHAHWRPREDSSGTPA